MTENEYEERNKYVELSKLKKGERGIIVHNGFDGNMRRRLQDMGFILGCEVECVGESLFADPRAYLLKGSVFAVRNSDAERILVSRMV